MDKSVKILYIFRLCENDFGPLQHINALKKYCNIILSISNFCLNEKNIYIHSENSFLSIIIFQLKASFLLLKYRKEYDIILHRVSCADLLFSIVASLIGKKYISEYNGDLIQDLIDRNKSSYTLSIQKILNYVNSKLSNWIYLVDENLTSIFPLPRSQIISKSIILNNGFEPIELIKNDNNSLTFSAHYVNLGYLGSLSHREGLVSALDLVNDFPTVLSLTIVGGTRDEFNALMKLYPPDLNVKHFENRSRVDALHILKNCDFFLFLRLPKTHSDILSQGSPLKLLDYYFLQKPVIFSKLPNHQEYIKMSLGIFINDFILYLKGSYHFNFNINNCINYTSSRSWSNILKRFNNFIENNEI